MSPHCFFYHLENNPISLSTYTVFGNILHYALATLDHCEQAKLSSA